jgi:hypothetical protein
MRAFEDRIIEFVKSRDLGLKQKTDCPAHLKLKLIKQMEKYIVSDLIAEHNHDFQGAEAKHLI